MWRPLRNWAMYDDSNYANEDEQEQEEVAYSQMIATTGDGPLRFADHSCVPTSAFSPSVPRPVFATVSDFTLFLLP